MTKHRLTELFYFGLAGVLGFLADFLTTTLFHKWTSVYVARIPAFFAAVTITWLFNRNITFRASTTRHESLVNEFAHYASLMLFGLGVNYVVYATTITFIGHRKYAILVSVALGSLAGMAVNYLTSKKHLYNKTKV